MKPGLPIRYVIASLLAGGALGLPARSAAAADAKPQFIYTLTVTDRIHVEVEGENDLTASQRIDSNGNLNLTYVGEVHVGGLNLQQAQHAIEDAYVKGRYLRHPHAILSVEDYAPRMVSIQGAVKNPGRFELPTESTESVVELVTKAGGFTDIGKGSDVRITHASGPGGEKSIQHVDVQGIITGRSSIKPDDPSLLLQPGDIVYVPEKLI